MASIYNLSEIAIGNVIGNSIIAFTLFFALPSLFYKIKFKSVKKAYFIIIYLSLIFIFLSFLISYGFLIFGILSIFLYFHLFTKKF